jgi:hypothetical protein
MDARLCSARHPLVDRTAAEEVISAWLDLIAGHARLPKLVLLPYLPADGPLADVLRRALARRAGGMAWFGKHARACLAPPASALLISATQCMGKNARNCGANASGSPKWGTSSVLPTRRRPTSALASVISWNWKPQGWKGRAGTAARSREETANFVARAVSALAREALRRFLISLRVRLLTRAVAKDAGSPCRSWSWASLPGRRPRADIRGLKVAP